MRNSQTKRYHRFLAALIPAMAKPVVAGLVLCSLSLTSCVITPERLPKQGEVEHVVLLWLKNPQDTATREQIVSTTQSFKKTIPGIVSVSVGNVLSSDRPVVDDSFDIGLILRFRNSAALAAYEKHPAHVAAVNNVLKPAIRQLRVHDYTVQ